MRCYRLRGIFQLDNRKKGAKKRISIMRDILGTNPNIRRINKEFEEFGILDSTFLWHRKSLADGRNTVTFYENVVNIRAIKVKSK